MVSKTEETFIKLIKAKKPNLQDITSFLRNNNTINLNTLDSHGYNILHYAIKQENPDIVNILFNTEPLDDEHPLSRPDPNIETKDTTNGI